MQVTKSIQTVRESFETDTETAQTSFQAVPYPLSSNICHSHPKIKFLPLMFFSNNPAFFKHVNIYTILAFAAIAHCAG